MSWFPRGDCDIAKTFRMSKVKSKPQAVADYFGHDVVYKRLRASGVVGWDKTTEAYEQRRKQALKILDTGNGPTTGRLLELGCGAGNMSIWLAKQGYEVSGVDISPTAIEWAHSKMRDEGVHANLMVGDVLNLQQFGDNTFDFVLDGHCFHCIIGADRQRFLAEAHRVLKPGGYFFVDTMCGPVSANAFEGYDKKSRCTIFYNKVASRYFGMPDKIKKEVESAGFKIHFLKVEKDAPTHRALVIKATKQSL